MCFISSELCLSSGMFLEMDKLNYKTKLTNG